MPVRVFCAAAMLALSWTAQASSALFQQVGELDLPGNAEIVAAHPAGEVVATTNSENRSVDLVSIENPRQPMLISSVPMPGEPTSVAFSPDGNWVLAAIYVGNTKSAPPQPDQHRPGILALIDAAAPGGAHLSAILPVGHHPDSIAVSTAGNELSVVLAIENEPLVFRDGQLKNIDAPGQPDDISAAGYIEIITLNPGTSPADWERTIIRLEPGTLAQQQLLFGNDPQPEFVAISPDQQTAAVSLQENNGIVIIDLRSKVITHLFNVGSVQTRMADLVADDKIRFDQQYPDAARTEPLAGTRIPDAVAFSPDGQYILSADEGEQALTGGRGFSIWTADGQFVWDDGGQLEQQAAAAGLYPDDRSAQKGIEVEGVAAAGFGDVDYAFAVAERGSFLAIYDITTPARPEFVQLLPAGKGPEGVVAIPARGLVVVAAEKSGTLHVYGLGRSPAEP